MTSTIRRLAVVAAATLPFAIAPLLATPAHADETAAPDNNAPEVAALSQPGVVYETITYSAYAWSTYNEEFIDDEAFTVTATCTGFVVNPDGWIATAGHCVDPGLGHVHVRDAAADWALDNYYGPGVTFDEARSDVTLYIFDRNDEPLPNRVDRRVQVTLPATVTGGDPEQDLPARVIDWKAFEQGDAALVKVEATDLHALPLASEDPKIGDPITSVGYPGIIENYTDHDLVPTFQPGTISSEKTVGGGILPVHQLSQSLEGGVSGGPTVNGDGEVIGVVSAGFDGTDLSYASPIARVQELLSAAGVEASPSELTNTYREGVAALYDGDRATAVTALSEVVEAQPENELAAEQLTLAEALPVDEPARQDEGSDTVLVVAVAGGTVFLLLIILTTAIAIHRRQTAATGPAAPYPGYGYGGPVGGYGAQPVWATVPQDAPSVVGAQPVVAPVGFVDHARHNGQDPYAGHGGR